MSTSIDSLSRNLYGSESKFSKLEPLSSPLSEALISNSSSSNFSCPSLTSSNTLSSEDFTELDTDQDVVSPLQSPSLESTYAYDLAHVLSGSMGTLSLAEAEAATPRPLRVERNGYFHWAGKADDEGYEGESEAKRALNFRVKRRHGSLKIRKAGMLARSSQTDSSGSVSMSDDFTSHTEETKVMPDDFVSSASSLRDTGSNGSLVGTCSPTGIEIPVPRTSSSKPKEKKPYIGLGLGLPTTWNGQCGHRMSTNQRRKSSSIFQESEHGLSLSLSNRDELELPRASTKAILQPMDSVLEFVESPSPIEDLPPPVLSGTIFEALNPEAKLLQNRYTSLDSKLDWNISSDALMSLGATASNASTSAEGAFRNHSHSIANGTISPLD